MSHQNRREFLLSATAGGLYLALSPIRVLAADPCSIDHPFTVPRPEFSDQCPNCGMVRSMWGRTWFTFENSEGASQACSFHCLADVARKSGEDPSNVMAALYLDPQQMIPAAKSYFVVGSRAKGTMTMKSKIALASKAEAEDFSKSCGGEVVGFEKALAVAKAGLVKENPMLLKRRLKKGVIGEPMDNKDTCPVCGMYPARYPKNKCQVITREKNMHHFCSTQCMFEFLQHPLKYVKTKVVPFRIWVVDFTTGAWISGKTAYYVVGSGLQGPMGHEAFCFDAKWGAGHFAQQEGGTVLGFAQVTIELITPNPS